MDEHVTVPGASPLVCGNRLLTMTSERFCAWDLETGELSWEVANLANPMLIKREICPLGQYVIKSQCGLVQVIHADTGQIQLQLGIPDRCPYIYASMGYCRNTIIVFNYTTLCKINMETKDIKIITMPAIELLGMKVTRKHIVTLQGRLGVIVLDLDTLQELHRIIIRSFSMRLHITKDENFAIIITDGGWQYIDLNTGDVRVYKNRLVSTWSTRISPDTTKLLVQGDFFLMLLDAKTGSTYRHFDSKGVVGYAAFDPNGKQFFVLCLNECLGSYSLRSNRYKLQFNFPKEVDVRGIQVLPRFLLQQNRSDVTVRYRWKKEEWIIALICLFEKKKMDGDGRIASVVWSFLA